LKSTQHIVSRFQRHLVNYICWCGWAGGCCTTRKQKTDQRSQPKIPVVVSTGANVRHQHRLQQQPVLVAYTSPALDIGYRVMARPGSNASTWAPGRATNRYQMEKTTKAPVCDIDLCPFCSHWHRVMPRPGAALYPRQRHRLVL